MEAVMELLLRWAVPALCAGAAGWAAAALRRERQRDEAVRCGVQALLRDRLYSCYSRCREQGEYPIAARENASEMFRWYTALGGNGTVAHLLRELEALPTVRGGCGKGGKA